MGLERVFGKGREEKGAYTILHNTRLVHFYYSIFLGEWQWQRYIRITERGFLWVMYWVWDINKASWSEKQANPWNNTLSTVTCPLLTTQWPNPLHSFSSYKFDIMHQKILCRLTNSATDTNSKTLPFPFPSTTTLPPHSFPLYWLWVPPIHLCIPPFAVNDNVDCSCWLVFRHFLSL